jgi:hypothetical protein
MESTMNHPLMPVYRGVLALLLFLSAQAFAADGEIRRLSGGVFVNTTVASEGMEVNSGDMLSTGPGAWAIVVMSDGTVLNLKSDTKLEISDYVYDTADPGNNSSDVELGIGTLRYVSGLIAVGDASDVKIRVGNTTLGLRGSGVETSYDGSSSTHYFLSGSWTITHPNRSYTATGGQVLDLNDETGQGQLDPIPPGQGPSGEQGGDETGNLGSQDPAGRGPNVLVSAPIVPVTPTPPPPPPSNQGQAFSQDPVTGEDLGGDPVGPTADPNAGS